uniref:CD72 molecule n=1 Tax=Ursus americanus TaxID=9643 RepID=A0A452SKK2_URSAM
MAEAITYADLRFVKAPLKKSISSRLGQDPETDEDEELTYENVQVPSVSGGLASSGVGDKADLQVSQQLQQTNKVLEATNSSLRQQLHLKITQLGKREEDLQGSRRELALSQEALQEEQRVCQATQEQLQACQSEREKTKEALQSEEVQRTTLEQRLSSMRDALKPIFTCPLADNCCPVGWILNERSCFYISYAERTWEESQNHCKSLSSELATFNDISYSFSVSIPCLGENEGWERRGRAYPSSTSPIFRYYGQSSRCYKVQSNWPKIQQEDCTNRLPCICEMAAFKNPDRDHFLP